MRHIATGEWGDKIKRYTQFEHLQIKPNPKKAGSPQVAVQAEGEKVLKAISAQVSRICCIGDALAHAADSQHRPFFEDFDCWTGLSPVQDYVVLLDERGKSMTSEGMAKLIAKVM